MRVSSQEFAGWVTYWKVEPPIDDRLETLLAQLNTTLVNVNRKQGRRALTALDFMDWRRELQPTKSDKEIYEEFKRHLFKN